MALRDIRTGEMVDICRDWLGKQDVLLQYPLTAPFVDFVMTIQTELTESNRSIDVPLSAEDRAKTKTLLEALDKDWDHAQRVLFKAFELLALAFPDKAASYERASQALLPEGLVVVNTSYRNEAGESQRVAQRIDREPGLKDLLERSTLNGVKLSTWTNTVMDLGRKLGPLAATLEVPPERADHALREFKARQKWTSLVTTLRRNCELADWTPEHMASLFDQVDRISSQRDSGGSAKPESSETPAPAPA